MVINSEAQTPGGNKGLRDNLWFIPLCDYINRTVVNTPKLPEVFDELHTALSAVYLTRMSSTAAQIESFDRSSVV
jgi:hypothetical protein